MSSYTAAEVAMQLEQSRVNFLPVQKATDELMTALVSHAVGRILDIINGKPLPKRWDQYHAYYRRQVKKWQKRNNAKLPDQFGVVNFA